VCQPFVLVRYFCWPGPPQKLLIHHCNTNALVGQDNAHVAARTAVSYCVDQMGRKTSAFGIGVCDCGQLGLTVASRVLQSPILVFFTLVLILIKVSSCNSCLLLLQQHQISPPPSASHFSPCTFCHVALLLIFLLGACHDDLHQQ